MAKLSPYVPSQNETNKLLSATPKKELERLEGTVIDLPTRTMIYEPDQSIDYVYFPRKGVISAVKEFQNGDVIEVATIGKEGMVGIGVALGVPIPGNRVLAQVAGRAIRFEVEAFRRALPQRPQLYHILLRYSHALLQQIAQCAACNRAHTVDERCARWLLMSHDRAGESSFILTQDFLAQMLGVHRTTVSTAAGILQKAGMITYVRGRMTILDREALESAACECYQLILEQYEYAVGERP
jgi:CRP-like cAMP-binding protein